MPLQLQHLNDQQIIAAAKRAANTAGDQQRTAIELAVGYLVLRRAGATEPPRATRQRRWRTIRELGGDLVALGLVGPDRIRHRGVVGKRSLGSVRAALALP